MFSLFLIFVNIYCVQLYATNALEMNTHFCSEWIECCIFSVNFFCFHFRSSFPCRFTDVVPYFFILIVYHTRGLKFFRLHFCCSSDLIPLNVSYQPENPKFRLIFRSMYYTSFCFCFFVLLFSFISSFESVYFCIFM